MTRFLLRVSAALDQIARATLNLATLLLAAMLVLLNVEVVGRYLFSYSTLVADEYSGYLFVWMTFLGFAYALRSGQFLRVELAVSRMPPRLRGTSELVAAVLGLIVCGVAAYATVMLAYTSYRFGSVSIQPSATPLVWPQAVMPIGMLLLCIVYLDEALRRVPGLAPPQGSEHGR